MIPVTGVARHGSVWWFVMSDFDILLIEDSPAHADLVRMMLSRDAPALRLEHAECLQEGAARARMGNPSAALLDLHLPDARGLETLTRFRSTVPGPPVLILTAEQDEALAVRALEHGAQDYLIKEEMSGKLLLRAIRHAAARERRIQELTSQALTDPLTGLLNRRAFEEAAARPGGVGPSLRVEAGPRLRGPRRAEVDQRRSGAPGRGSGDSGLRRGAARHLPRVGPDRTAGR